jgi:hypothetical protein
MAFHSFDPTGDVILVLMNPRHAFDTEGVLEEESSSLAGKLRLAAANKKDSFPVSSRSKREISFSKKKNKKSSSFPVHERGWADDSHEDDFEALGARAHTETELTEPALSFASTEDTPGSPILPKESHTLPQPTLECGDPETIKLRVSSKHLALASSYFSRTLSDNWKEGNTLRKQGCLEMELKDWDAEAMMILMNIFHQRNRSIPRTLPLEMLTRVAALVDYYECHEAVELYADLWVANLKEDLPELYTREVLMWICISTVFKLSKEFLKSTKVALQNSRGPINTLRLPINPRIIGNLNTSIFQQATI